MTRDMRKGRLNACLGSHAPVGAGGGRGGGARWMRRATCPRCGKVIRVTRDGHLRTHGVRGRSAA
jgi:hypothetical protein